MRGGRRTGFYHEEQEEHEGEWLGDRGQCGDGILPRGREANKRRTDEKTEEMNRG